MAGEGNAARKKKQPRLSPSLLKPASVRAPRFLNRPAESTWNHGMAWLGKDPKVHPRAGTPPVRPGCCSAWRNRGRKVTLKIRTCTNLQTACVKVRVRVKIPIYYRYYTVIIYPRVYIHTIYIQYLYSNYIPMGIPHARRCAKQHHKLTTAVLRTSAGSPKRFPAARLTELFGENRFSPFCFAGPRPLGFRGAVNNSGQWVWAAAVPRCDGGSRGPCAGTKLPCPCLCRCRCRCPCRGWLRGIGRATANILFTSSAETNARNPWNQGRRRNACGAGEFSPLLSSPPSPAQAHAPLCLR